ncbi:MAG: hypothetical protein DWQ08_15595 [Proteobacteria bacterium]|nr:MAG: hypothetical protein DWQ08_15595 [Pseudomonadota bacterium]
MPDNTPKRIHAVVIPRGDPKGFPGRNFRVVFGRPVVAWVFDALKQARRVSGVFVSTNDDKIAGIAREAGCDTIPRPSEIDDDRASRVEIVRRAVTWLHSERSSDTDIVIAVRASIPELRSIEIDDAIEFLERNKLREVISVGPNNVQNDHFRMIGRHALFGTPLSSRIGVVRTEHIDVRSPEDVAALLSRYENLERFDAFRA